MHLILWMLIFFLFSVKFYKFWQHEIIVNERSKKQRKIRLWIVSNRNLEWIVSHWYYSRSNLSNLFLESSSLIKHTMTQRSTTYMPPTSVFVNLFLQTSVCFKILTRRVNELLNRMCLGLHILYPSISVRIHVGFHILLFWFKSENL
jgi:hypothetical protein